ncbi:hypothetical protein BST61_g5329 [Cercospora zeina]
MSGQLESFMAAKKPYGNTLPTEVIENVLRYLLPPSPETLGRARHEHIEFEDENAEAVNRFTAASHKDLLSRLKTDDAEHKLGLITLTNATRACLRFREITQPLLYESFPGQPLANLQLLNRTLIGRPDLARMVSKITIGEWDVDMLSGLDKWWRSTISKVELSVQLIVSLDSKAKEGSEDAQVALLLMLCTEVRAIDISVPVLFKSHSVVNMLMVEIIQERPNTLFRGADRIAPSLMHTSLPLRKLRDASLRSGNVAHTMSIGVFEKLMSLKTLKRLTLYRTSGEAGTFPCLSALERLCLWRCEAGTELVPILAQCGNLRSLEVVWAGCTMDYMHNVFPLDTVIDYKQIGSFIAKHLVKLETLLLDPREPYLFGRSCKQLHSLDFSSMKHLKELSVEAQALWHQHVTDELPQREIKAPLPRLQDILPPSLNKLAVLADRRSDHMWALKDYAITRNAKLMLYDCARYLIDAPACLQSIHLDVPYMEVSPGLTELADLFADLNCSTLEIIGDPAVQRASPVVGATTPREQRIKLRAIFHVWSPNTNHWPSVVIERNGAPSQGVDWEKWRKFMEDKVEVARGWFRWEQY